MKIDEVIEVSENIIMNENITFIKDLLNKMGRMSWDSAKKFLKEKAKEFVYYIRDNADFDENAILRIVNTRLDTHFSNMNSLFAKALVERTDKLDEGLKDWWAEAKTSMYGALSFYPLLTVFLELDKVIKGSGDANVRAMMIYFIVWVLIVSGKVISGIVDQEGDKAKANPKSWAEMMSKLENNQ